MSDDLSEVSAGEQRSRLLDLLDQAGAHRVLREPAPDLGLAEHLPFPFLAIVGQYEMRMALLLAVINPAIGGVLLIGPRGTGKTTCVRSLTDLLPYVEVSLCPEGCLPPGAHGDGAADVCPDCQRKLTAGEPISHYEAVKLVELPLNARLEDVVGGINERIAVQQGRVRLELGILARADQNLLYIDEVNLLDDLIVDAILDAAAQGSYTVRRGPMVGTYRARFVLVGSMNPEEGRLRPQIMDRFGLRVPVHGLADQAERYEVYRRVRRYQDNRRRFLMEWAEVTAQARDEIGLARELLRQTGLSAETVEVGLALVQALGIDSHRAEYAMFEAARAHAAADGRDVADVGDLRAVAALALRQRRSQFMAEFFAQQGEEDAAIRERLDALIHNGR
ncbi:MAG: magnesium chelatase [Anaerolineae bacterium]|nr:magnesium chelatase [Anaerolineae bacterium]